MPEKGFAHVLLLLILLIGLVFGVYLVQQRTNLFSKAFQSDQSIDELTQELLSLNNSSGRSAQDSSRVAQMITLAQKRKAQLLPLIELSSEQFLKAATLADQRADFPEEVRALIEENKTLSGNLSIIHSDLPSINSANEDYLLQEAASGKLYKLYPAALSNTLESGPNSGLVGISLEYNLALKQVESSSRAAQSTRTASFNQIGNHKVAVILTNFTDYSGQPFTLDQIRSVLTSNPQKSVPNYYQENSYGQLNLGFDFYDWITISANSQDCSLKPQSDGGWGGGYWEWGLRADQKIREQNIKLENYDFLIYVFPNIKSCGVDLAGTASIGKSFFYSDPFAPSGTNYNPAKIWIYQEQFNPLVYIHELGHNLGLNHANALNCRGKQIDDYSNCLNDTRDVSNETGSFEGIEGGDIFDSLGFTDQWSHFNGPHKLALGWIPPANVLEITQDGIYNIQAPVETSSDKIQLLRVAKPDTDEYYFLSFRKPTEIEDQLPATFTSGASINIWHLNPSARTRLVNTLPQPSLDQAPLTDGRFFYDSKNKIVIKQLKHDLNSVTVEVKFNSSPEPIPLATPTPVIIPTQAPTPLPNPGKNSWNIIVKPLCGPGKVAGVTKVVYVIWPPNPLKWTEQTTAGEHILRITADNNSTVSSVYLSLAAPDGSILTIPSSRLPHQSMQFNTYFNPPILMVKWNKDELPPGTYTLEFNSQFGNTDVCRTST